MQKLLVIGLDGYEASVADALISEGRLPHLARLKSRGARFLLDHGKQKFSGLAWEHFSTGQAPEVSGRWSAVSFDPATYRVSQEPTRFEPFLKHLSSKAVVFDAPYFDLGSTPEASGIVNWGAHDPGVAPLARPAGLGKEILEKFGPYPAADSIYAFTWPSVTRTRAAGDSLVAALDQRTEISRWLFAERFRDWELGLVVVSELHSVIEPMWHGLDPNHALHAHETATPSRRAVEAVYEALDRLIGTLRAALPDAAVLAFSMHGMGPNTADVASMLLLPDLLHRWEFGRSLYEPRPDWRDPSHGLPNLEGSESWEEATLGCIRHPGAPPRNGSRSLLARVSNWLMQGAWRPGASDPAEDLGIDASLGWMPATQYQPYWPRMRAFALPAFYDGRIRVNLEGRERQGRVPLGEYEGLCLQIESLLKDCRDPWTGEPVVAAVERCAENPLELSPTNGDLTVTWNGPCLGLLHGGLGLVGPAPTRRTGGHTGGFGVLYADACGLGSGDRGLRSSFDVAPTIVDLLGQPRPRGMSGRSLLDDGA